MNRYPDEATRRSLGGIADEIATKAGRLIAEERPAKVEVAATKSSVVDVVTAMDTASEALIRAELARLRPGDGILGEENGYEPGDTGLTWIVDPIDGTVNYLYGLPYFAVSIAVVSGPPEPQEWTALAAAVCAPALSQTWIAQRGLGASRRGASGVTESITANPPVELGVSLIGTGFGYEENRRRGQGQVVSSLLPKIRDIRRLGSAAIDLCLVADGRLDVMYERGLKPWDMAAGALIAEEAGAVVAGSRGRRADGGLLVAGPSKSVENLLQILEDAGADRDPE